MSAYKRPARLFSISTCAPSSTSWREAENLLEQILGGAPHGKLVELINLLSLRHGLRTTPLAGASVVALAAAAPSAGAADMNKPMPMKAPPVAPVAKDTWT